MKIASLKKIISRDEGTVPAVAPKKSVAKKVVVKKAATKVAKAAAPKKAPAKKAAAKKTATRKRLVVASDSESFWVTNGHVLNSLYALELAFADMSKSVYEYHISSTGSDFADWVEAVLFDQDCASELRKAKTAKTAHAVVTKFLKQYEL